MASVKGTNFTNITADPVVKIDSGEWSGKMRVQYDTYEASSLASGSDISVARLPKGAKVYDVVIIHDALGSGVTLKVGDDVLYGKYSGTELQHEGGDYLIMKENDILAKI